MHNNITFYLARHGQTQWNIEQRIQGQLDSPLTGMGQQQALLLAEQCKALHITHVLTSPLGRAVETAVLCADTLGVSVKKVVGFEERHFGCWQGKFIDEVNSKSIYDEVTAQLTHCRPAQGESAIQALQRFQKAMIQQLEQHSHPGRCLIIVHGELLRCFMGELKQQAQTLTGYDYKNGELIALTYDRSQRLFHLL